MVHQKMSTCYTRFCNGEIYTGCFQWLYSIVYIKLRGFEGIISSVAIRFLNKWTHQSIFVHTRGEGEFNVWCGNYIWFWTLIWYRLVICVKEL